MEWRTDPAILAFFVLVFLVSLPFALVKSRRHREETRAWLSGEDGHEPAATVPAGSVEPRRSLTRELACRVAGARLDAGSVRARSSRSGARLPTLRPPPNVRSKGEEHSEKFVSCYLT